MKLVRPVQSGAEPQPIVDSAGHVRSHVTERDGLLFFLFWPVQISAGFLY